MLLALLTALLVVAGTFGLAVGPWHRPDTVSAASPSNKIGLSLFFQNGQMAPLTLVGNPLRYLQEVDIVVTTPTTTTDQGIAPLVQSSEMAGLNWHGIQLVEDDWRQDLDGTWILQRFYRGAHWMEQPSHFTVTPVNAQGQPVGPPLLAQAGKDDQWQSGNDGFVRRFVVRQIVRGCADLDDCTGATSFTVQGLVQLRDALHPAKRAVVIPPPATALRLAWSADPHTVRTVALSHSDLADWEFGYGLQLALEVLNTPPRGYFLASETVQLRLTYLDGQGQRLHAAGELPTFGQFMAGTVASGIRYFDGLALFPSTYYALKHREGNTTVTFSGPTNRLKTPLKTIQGFELFAPQVTVASSGLDGYSAVTTIVPAAAVIFVPALWDTPVSDTVSLTIPDDAPPGTYVAAFKGRRDWGGEALNRGTTVEIQVGQEGPTTFVPSTGPCNTCHSGPSGLGNVLHGLSDRRACYSCHAGLAFEPDAPLDIRVHMVHSRSQRFVSAGGDIQNCALCHLEPEEDLGPFRNSGLDGLP
jgi:hypothetical protein